MWRRFFRLIRFWKKRSAPPAVSLNPRLLSVYFGNVQQGK